MLYTEVGPRGNGKTKRLLEYAKNNNATVVCNMPRAMEEKAREYGLGDINCMSYSTFLNVVHKIRKEKIVIDEIEGLLNRLSPNIEGYTLGLEENEKNI